MKQILIYISYLCCSVCFGQTIETIAGTGTNAHGGDGGLATQASFATPFDVAVDDAGNVYVSESGAGRVRRIDAITGIITTIFGGGSDSGDGILGPNYLLDNPGYIQVHNNALYVSDYSLHKILKMSLVDSIVTTIAGNGSTLFSADGSNASVSSIGRPYGLDFDVDGTLYFVENENNRVRYIDPNGNLQTLCGIGSGGTANTDGPSGTGTLSDPWGLTIYNGHAYNTDFSNSTVREINLQDGYITTLNLPGGSFNGDGMNIANTTLSYAIEVEFDVEGNMLIADNEADRIRKVDHDSQIVSTIVGTGNPGYSGDGGHPLDAEIHDPIGMVLDQYGNLIFVGNDNFVVRKVVFCKDPDQPIINVDNNQTTIECGETITLRVVDGFLNGADYWEWYAGSCEGDLAGQGDSITVTLVQSTDFYAIGKGGCTQIADCGLISINVLDCPTEDEVITAFSPNNDGVNDFLVIEEAYDYPSNSVQIFNRWGDLLLSLTNYDNEAVVWSSEDQFGNIVESGTYFYIFESDNVRLVNWVFVAK